MYLEGKTSVGQSLVFRMFKSESRVFVKCKTFQFLVLKQYIPKLRLIDFGARLNFLDQLLEVQPLQELTVWSLTQG
jgi:hypothetical protein